MQTPEFRQFLDEVGKVVHHLNTIVVGLAAVETGLATKPDSLDVSWSPADPRSSGRQARAFTLRATLVMVAEELGAFVEGTASSPACPGLQYPPKADRAVKLTAIKDFLSIEEDHLFLGPLLLVHWRNRIIHRASKANLSKAQRAKLVSESALVKEKYKNLDPNLLLEHFDKSTPTLKDVSSLVAMTINFVKCIQSKVIAPNSRESVLQWIAHFGLAEELDRVKRVATAKGKPDEGISHFLNSHEPSLAEAYTRHCADEA